MSSVPSKLYNQIRKALLDCGPFENYAQLKGIFAHPKLKPWRHSVPQAPSSVGLVDATIDLLMEKRRADTQENALVLLLRVLSERLDPGDECHHRLSEMADQLEIAITGVAPSLQTFAHDIQRQISQGQVQTALDELQSYLLAHGASDLQTKPADVIQESALPEKASLEKILGLNNLKQISWIQQGTQISKSVCRILVLIKGKYLSAGTGFLMGPSLLMTNNHVIPDKATAGQAVIEFNYQQGFDGQVTLPCRYKLDTGHFHTNPDLDYTIVGLLPEADKPGLDSWGHVLLNPYADPIPGEHVIIVQHPNGGLKQIVVTNNRVVNVWEHRLQYTTDTMPGSSGSPVFNDLWQVVAIHHAGGDLQADDQGNKRFINEGILMSAIKTDAGGLWPE